MHTVLPLTVTNGRESDVFGAGICRWPWHRVDPRGCRQNRRVLTVGSSPYHAMPAMPAASTATPGLPSSTRNPPTVAEPPATA